MSDQPWKENDAEETPIAVVRSAPIRIRFAVRDCAEEKGLLVLRSFFGDRQLARRRVAPERISGRSARCFHSELR